MFSIPMKFTVTTNVYLEDEFGNTIEEKEGWKDGWMDGGE